MADLPVPSFLQKLAPVEPEDMTVGTPPTIRLVVDRDGTIKIKRGGDVLGMMPPGQDVVGIVVAYSKPRAYWEDSEVQGPPTCTAVDGVKGSGTKFGKCSKCQYAQFGSAPQGNGQACKQMVRIALYIPDADAFKSITSNFEDGPEPVIVSLTPSNLKEWDAFGRWYTRANKQMGNRLPLQAVWLKLSPEVREAGGRRWGVFKLSGFPLKDSDAPHYQVATNLMDDPVIQAMKTSGADNDDYQAADDNVINVAADDDDDIGF